MNASDVLKAMEAMQPVAFRELQRLVMDYRRTPKPLPRGEYGVYMQATHGYLMALGTAFLTITCPEEPNPGSPEAWASHVLDVPERLALWRECVDKGGFA